GRNTVVIDGGGTTRIFNVTAGPTTLSSLILSNASSYSEIQPDGGAIRNLAQLTLENCEIVNCAAFGSGGAVANLAPGGLLVGKGCTFGYNSAFNYYFYTGDGGAIWNNQQMSLTNCTFYGNF